MPVDLALTTLLGRYRLVRRLGAGGMGTVYLAEDLQLRRLVAVKVPHFAASDFTEAEGKVIVERFLREAQFAARIEHPNLCPVYDTGQDNDTNFLVMPYIEGQPLSRMVGGEQAWPIEDAVALIRKLALALQVLHEHGIVHRDLKPANVMVRASGEPVIMDFGLARSYAAASKQVTHAGAGTPSYMAPEQAMADAKAIGPATDIYALGVLLYELLTGSVPFHGNFRELYLQVVGAPPTPPLEKRPGLDPSLNAACLKALAKNPDDRFRSMTEFAAALGQRPTPTVLAPARQIVRYELPSALETESPHDWTLPGTRRRWISWRFLGVGFLVLAMVGLTAALVIHFAGRNTPSASKLPPVPSAKMNIGVIRMKGKEPFAVVQAKQSAIDNRREAAHVSADVVPLLPPDMPVVLMALDGLGPPRYRGSEKLLDILAATESSGIQWATYDVERRSNTGRGANEPAVLDCGGEKGADDRTVKAVQAAWADHRKTKIETEIDLGGGAKMKMVLVPPGRFWRGASDGKPDEKPLRLISLDEPFFMGKYEVTVGQFKQFVKDFPEFKTMAENRGEAKTWKNPGFMQADDEPVVFITWHDARKFCDWVGKKCGRDVYLPSEAEWEYCCRAGTRTRFFFGDDESRLSEFAWFSGNTGAPTGTREVGKKSSNRFGLCDMHGNAWEWCENFYSPTCEGLPVNEFRSYYVLRGGNWKSADNDCRASARGKNHSTSCKETIGFRVACGFPK